MRGFGGAPGVAYIATRRARLQLSATFVLVGIILALLGCVCGGAWPGGGRPWEEITFCSNYMQMDLNFLYMEFSSLYSIKCKFLLKINLYSNYIAHN
jgi:hypothetical protein